MEVCGGEKCGKKVGLDPGDYIEGSGFSDLLTPLNGVWHCPHGVMLDNGFLIIGWSDNATADWGRPLQIVEVRQRILHIKVNIDEVPSDLSRW